MSESWSPILKAAIRTIIFLLQELLTLYGSDELSQKVVSAIMRELPESIQ